MHTRVAEAERICGHQFKNRELIEAALTHPSATEHKPIQASYERLEFLGDSVLGAIVANDLFLRFPSADEGELSRYKVSLVSGQTLSRVADALGVAPLILMGESERGTAGRGMRAALENVYEAIVGALYLDAGYEVTHRFVVSSLEPHMEVALAKRYDNPKSILQEVTQRDYRLAPEYKLVSEDGPAHDPTFTSVAIVDGTRIGRGMGPSKKTSESAAAADALIRMGHAEPTDFDLDVQELLARSS